MGKEGEDKMAIVIRNNGLCEIVFRHFGEICYNISENCTSTVYKEFIAYFD